MTVYIVIFDKAAYRISSKLFSDIASYIDDHYVETHINKTSEAMRHQKQFREMDLCESISLPEPSNVPLEVQKIPSMTEDDYSVYGCTALLDAIGGAIHHIGNVHKYARTEDVPEHTVFIIMTDGMENASHIYRIDKVKQMIERQKEKYGWEFLFLGANIDAIETANHFGINADKAANYQCDCEGTALNYEVLNDAISAVRCNAALDSSWKKRIDKDYKKRGQHSRVD